MKINYFNILLLFFFGAFSQGKSIEINNNYCPVLSIKTTIQLTKQKAYSTGQGWNLIYQNKVIDKKESSKYSLSLTHYILTPYHVISGSSRITGTCPYDKKEWELEIVGTSPTYDLALLRIKPRHLKKTVENFIFKPLFELDTDFHLINVNLPLDEYSEGMFNPSIDNFESGASAFVYTSQNTLHWITAGISPSVWNLDSASLAPYSKAITPLSGVRPGMSGGLLMTVKPEVKLLGMILGVKFNRGLSLIAPFDEILPLLPYLINAKDPRREGDQKNLSYIEFIPKQIENEVQRFRYLYRDNFITNIKELLASDLCSSSRAGGAQGLTGGATIGDATGGATVGDGSEVFSREEKNIETPTSPVRVSSVLKNFSDGTQIWKFIPGEGLKAVRNVFQKTDLCQKEGVWWHPSNNYLFGIRLNNLILPIESIRDLIYIEKNYFNQNLHNPIKQDFKAWINKNGIFGDSDIFNNIKDGLCSQTKAVSPNYDLGIFSETNILNFGNDVFYRLFHDQGELIYNENLLSQKFNILKTGPGYICEKNQLKIVGSNYLNTISTKNSNHTYMVYLKFNRNNFDFKFLVSNNDSDQKTNQPLILSKLEVPYAGVWNHFIDVDGFKFFIHLLPDKKQIEVSLISIPNSFNSKTLLSTDGENYLPLAGINLSFSLEPQKN